MVQWRKVGGKGPDLRKLVRTGRVSCITLLCLCTFLAFGARGYGEEITLREALERSLLGNPEIRKAELQLEIAQSALKGAREDTFSPTIAIGETIKLFGEVRTGLSLQLKDTISFDPTLWEEEEVNLEKSRRVLEATREEVKKKVISAYLDILRAEENLAIAQKNLEFLEESMGRLKEEYERGEAASFALKEAEGKYREGKAEVEALRAQIRLLKEEFFALLGEEGGDDTVFLPLPEFSPSLPETFSWESFVSLRDEIEDLEGQKRVSEALLAGIRRKQRPQVVLQGVYERDNWSFSSTYNFSQKSLEIALGKSLGPEESTTGESFGVGLAVEWSFSPSLSEEKKQTELRKEALLLDLEVAQKEVLFDIREKYLGVLRARDVLESKRMLLEARTEIHAQGEKQFDLGVVDRVALLESELNLLRAQAEYRNAQYDLLVNFVGFLRSIEQPILWEALFPREGGKGE